MIVAPSMKLAGYIKDYLAAVWWLIQLASRQLSTMLRKVSLISLMA